jgi:hypothetical protein
MCPGKYIYDFIVEDFFKRVYLDTAPSCYLDLFQNCKSIIVREKLFAGCDSIESVLYQYLPYFIQDYEF